MRSDRNRERLVECTAMFALLAAGCSAAGSVTGTVSGESVPSLSSGAMMKLDDEGPMVVGLWTSLGDTCGLAAHAIAEVRADEPADPGDTSAVKAATDKIVSFVADNVPEDFWFTVVAAITEAQVAANSGKTVAFSNDQRGPIDFVDVEVCHMKAHPVTAVDETTGSVLVWKKDCARAASGSLTLSYAAGAHLGVDGKLKLVATTGGADAGDVDVSATASFCRGFNDELNALHGDCQRNVAAACTWENQLGTPLLD